MKNLYFILLFTWMGFAQHNYADSILVSVNQLSPKQGIQEIKRIPYNKFYANISKAIALSDKGIELSLKQKDSVSLATFYYKKFVALRLSDKEDKALSFALNAISILEKKESDSLIGKVYGDLGFSMKYRDLPKAMIYMRLGAQYLESVKDSIGLGGVYDNYGILKRINKEPDSAVFYHLKSLKYKKGIKDSVGIPYNYAHLADVYLSDEKFNPTLAKKYIDSTYFLRLELKDPFGISDALLYYGDYYLKTKKFNDAITAYTEAVNISKKNNFKFHEKYAYDFIAKTYIELKDYEKAYEYKEKYQALQDSSLNIKTQEAIAGLEVAFETEKKEKELLKTKAEKAEADLKLTKRTIWMYSLLGGLLLLLIGGYAFFQKRKRSHQQEKHLAVVKEKEAGLQAVIQAEEKERARIAKELHDGLVQDIGSVILGWRSKITDDESKSLLTRLESANDELRHVSHQLMPKALEELGLVAALKDMLQNSLTYATIEYEFEYFNVKNRLPKKVELTIYRIAQELVNNIIKHSQASKVSVQLFKNKVNVLFLVEDNGSGIKPNKKQGIGLLNIKSRLNLLKGEVNFEPSPNSGTLVTVKIPL